MATASPPVPPVSCSGAFEHPADLAIVSASQPVIAFLRERLRLTPNLVTGLSFLFTLAALLLLWRGNLAGFAAASLASYYFDDLDGAMARRYRLTSDVGELLDHLSDLAYFLGVLAILAVRYRALRLRPGWFALLALSGLVPAAHNAAANRSCGTDSGAIGVVAAVLAPSDRAAAADLASALRPLGGISYQLLFYAGVCGLVLLLRRDGVKR
jgi:phosphatidylglycerophosphate synthase